jgi:Zn-dependent peptidase ImmA (M78 family)
MSRTLTIKTLLTQFSNNNKINNKGIIETQDNNFFASYLLKTKIAFSHKKTERKNKIK